MLLSISILAISLSLDALGVGMAYGLRKVRIPFISKLMICLFSILYSAISLAVGKSLSTVLPPEASKLIGTAVLVLMGIWIIVQSFLKKDDPVSNKQDKLLKEKTLFNIAIKSLGITIQVIKNPASGDIDKSGTIDVGESILLGLALSVDSIGVGIGSGLAGFDSIAIPFAAGLFQLIFLYTGFFLGEKFVSRENINKKLISVLPGILLILLAIIRIY